MMKVEKSLFKDFFINLIHLFYIPITVLPPSSLPFPSLTSCLSLNPLLFHSEKRYSSYGSQHSMANQVEARINSSLCTNVGIDIPEWGIDSKKPVHKPGIGSGPIARGSKNRLRTDIEMDN